MRIAFHASDEVGSMLQRLRYLLIPKDAIKCLLKWKSMADVFTTRYDGSNTNGETCHQSFVYSQSSWPKYFIVRTLDQCKD